jgi:hypothetical protein
MGRAARVSAVARRTTKNVYATIFFRDINMVFGSPFRSGGWKTGKVMLL